MKTKKKMYNGRISVNVGKQAHRELAKVAFKNRSTMNDIINIMIREKLYGEEIDNVEIDYGK